MSAEIICLYDLTRVLCVCEIKPQFDQNGETVSTTLITTTATVTDSEQPNVVSIPQNPEQGERKEKDLSFVTAIYIFWIVYYTFTSCLVSYVPNTLLL